MRDLFRSERIFSLKVKATLIAVSTGLVIFLITAYVSSQFSAREFETHYKEKAILVWRHIIHELESGMFYKAHEVIPGTLDFYRASDEIVELRVFNSKGQEVFAREKGPPEPKVEEALRTGDLVYLYREIRGHEVATAVIPLKNKPDCQGCHGVADGYRGALLLSLSTESMKQDIFQQQRRYALILAFLTIVMIVISLITVNMLFLRPLLRIERGTQAIESGDFKYRIPVTSRDEIASLGKHFNRMAETLQQFFEELAEKSMQMTEQLRVIARSQKEWQETFDSITDQIAVIDREFSIIKANRAFMEYFSLGEDGLKSTKCHELFGPSFGLGCPDQPNYPHVRSARERVPITTELRDGKTGNILQISFFPYSSPEGDYLGSIYIARDVTEKKESEMGLIMTERLAALGQMASGIAHELNNPLATIAACAEGLLKRMRDERFEATVFTNYLEIIEDEIMRCKNITMSMLSFVRKTTDDKREINVNEALEKTVELINFQGRLKEVQVVKQYGAGLPVTRGNEGEIRQVFLSIIVNALDAMEDKGVLTLETGIEGKSVLVKITDTGPGIPGGLIKRIFDPFFTTKSEKGGTGLGLSIAHKIVKAHDGTIDVISGQGQNTTFRIVLPV